MYKHCPEVLKMMNIIVSERNYPCVNRPSALSCVANSNYPYARDYNITG